MGADQGWAEVEGVQGSKGVPTPPLLIGFKFRMYGTLRVPACAETNNEGIWKGWGAAMNIYIIMKTYAFTQAFETFGFLNCRETKDLGL